MRHKYILMAVERRKLDTKYDGLLLSTCITVVDAYRNYDCYHYNMTVTIKHMKRSNAENRTVSILYHKMFTCSSNTKIANSTFTTCTSCLQVEKSLQ